MMSLSTVRMPKQPTVEKQQEEFIPEETKDVVFIPNESYTNNYNTSSI